ncbi:hypothetical protein PQX77_003501 [Marasmius sp. AFHP31]|nr:hypothetical protein PQX77_003501 [Marasmius sp. AFHP31]
MSLLLAGLSYRQLGPDSTAPTPSSSGETRTTANIVWSCLSMVILCTWTSVRPNVHSVPRSGHWTRVYWDNAKLFLVALIAPEFIVQWSICQWLAARRMAKEYQKYGWTITHAFFALMGGFALTVRTATIHSCEYSKSCTLMATSPLEYCVANKMIIMTDDEIENLGHTDLLAKTVAMIQTLHFITNCIARGVNGLILTELEYFTLGFAALNLVSYSFWWHKPSKVRFPVRIMVRPKSPSPQPSSDSQDQNEEPKSRLLGTGTSTMPSEARAPGILSPSSDRIWDDYGDGEWDTWSLRRRILWTLLLPLRAARRTLDYAMKPRSSRHPENGNIFLAGYSRLGDGLSFILMLFAGVILGIFHCIPIMLHRDFPDETQERRLWTVFALLTTVLPLGTLILVVAAKELVNPWKNWVTTLVTCITITVTWLSLPLYLTARIGLMVLVAEQLTDLPPSALQQVDWMTLVPHFGV